MASQYSAAIDLSVTGNASSALQGIAQQLSSINNIISNWGSSTNSAAGGVNNLATAVTNLKQSVTGIAAPVAAATRAINGMAQSKITAAASANALTGQVGRAASAILGFGGNMFTAVGVALIFSRVVSTLSEHFTSLIKTGLEFNAVMELGRLGIAATIITVRGLAESMTGGSTAAQRFASAVAEAAKTQALLRSAAFQTTATFVQLESGLEQLTSAMAGQKVTMEEVTKLTTTVANMAQVLHVPFDTAYRQITLALEGMARATGRIGAFFKSLGVNNEILQYWREQGVVFQRVQVLLEEFNRLGPEVQKTFTGLLSNVQDAIQQLAGVATQGLFESLKRQMKGFVDSLVTIKDGEIIINPEIKRNLEEFSDALGKIADVAGPAFLGFLDVLGRGVSSITRLLGAMQEVIQISPEFAKSMASWMPLNWGPIKILEAVAKAMERIALAKVAVQGAAGSFPLLNKMLNYFGMSGKSTGEDEFTGPPEPTAAQRMMAKDQIELATQSMNEFINKSKNAWQVAGLTGYARAVAEVNARFDETNLRMDKLASNLKEKFPYAASVIDQMAAGFKDLGNAARGAEIGRVVDQWDEKAEDLARRLNGIGESIVNMDSKQTPSQLEKQMSQLAGQIDNIAQDFKDLDHSSNAFALLTARADNLKRVLEAIGALRFGESTDNEANKVARGLADIEYEIAKIDKLGKQNILERLRDEEEAARESVEKRLAAKKQMYGEDVRYSEALKALSAATNDALLRIDKQYQERRMIILASQATDWATLWDNIVSQGEDSFATLQENASELARLIDRDGRSLSDGVIAGFARIVASTKTETQAMSDFVVSAWQSMGKALDDAFFKLLTGKFNDLKNVLKDFGRSLLESFSHMLSEMLQTLISSAVDLKKIVGKSGTWSVTSDEGPTQPTYSGGSGLLGALGGTAIGPYIGAGLAGFGVGSAIGATSGAPGFNTGSTIGGTLGGIGGWIITGTEVGGLYGAIIGAIVGGLIAVLSHPDTNIHYPISGSSLYLRGNKEYANGEIGGSIFDTRNTLVAGMLGISRAAGMGTQGAEDSRLVLMKAIREMSVDIWAGSKEDVQKNIEFFLKTDLPRFLLGRLFGQTETPGGTRNPGIGVSGLPAQNAGSFDPNAPLPKMLYALGFTRERISELSKMVATDDPKKVLEYIKGIVGVVKTFKDLSEKLGMDRAGLVGEASKSPAQQFATRAADLKILADSLKYLGGDEQLQAAQQLAQESQQFFQDMISYIKQLDDLQKGLNKSLDELSKSLTNAFETPGDRAVRMGNRLNEILNTVGQQTPEKVNELAQEAISIINELAQGLVSLINNIKALRTGLGSAGSAEAAWGVSDFRSKANAFHFAAQGFGDISDPAERLRVGQELYDQATIFYQQEIAFLRNAQSILNDIVKQTQSQVESMRRKLMSGSEVEAQARATIEGFSASLANAKSPDEVAALFESASAAVSDLFDILYDRYQRLQSLGVDFGNMASDFGNIHGNAAGNKNTAFSFVGDALAFQQQVRDAAKLTGEEQVRAYERIREAASKAYQEQLDMIQRIGNAVKSINESIDAQERDIRMSGMSPQERWQFLLNEIPQLQMQIASAQTPEEVQRLAGIIQDDVRALGSLAGEMGPSFVEKWLLILEDTRNIVNQRLAAMDAATTSAASIFQNALKEAGTSVSGVADALKAALSSLATQLEGFGASATTAINGMIAAVVEAGNRIANELGPVEEALRGSLGDLQLDIEALRTLVNTNLNGTINDVIESGRQLQGAIDEAKATMTGPSGLSTAASGAADQVSRLGSAAGRAADIFEAMLNGDVPQPTVVYQPQPAYGYSGRTGGF